MIQAIDRAARVLARAAGLPAPGHHRARPRSSSCRRRPCTGIVKSLQEHGLVAKEPHGQRYMLGPDPAPALQRLPRHPRRPRPGDALDRRPRASAPGSPSASASSSSTRSSSSTTSRAPTAPEQMPETGRDDPAPRLGAGQGAARLRRRTFARSLLARPLRSLTGETIVDPDASRRRSRDVGAKGFAVEDEEAVLGEASVAVPTATPRRVIAAIAVVLPASE